MTSANQIGPLIEGSNLPLWTVTYKTTDNAPIVLTGATFTGALRNAKSAHVVALTAGNYSISNAASGIFTYAPTMTETGTHGSWLWETAITISGSVHKIVIPVLIVPKLAS